MTPRISVIVPAHRAPHHLARCIAALRSSELTVGEWELIVADDGSDDADTSLEAAAADRVVTLPSPAGGPARARNAGAEAARAPIVAFVDADVLVHPDTLRRMLEVFEDPTVAAAFGSYDDAPAGRGVVSQYRNLLHHHVHERSVGDVESFWAGCGAVRREAFVSVGMFDANRFRRPEMEDVELGYRLRDEGHRIVLDQRILCTHLKRWTLGAMIKSDFARRGVPWARLLVERGSLLSPRGLSLGANERAGALLACATLIAALGAAVWRSTPLLLLVAALLTLFVLANSRLFSWLSRIRGSWFAARVVPLHLIYNVVAVLALLWGATLALLSRPNGQARYTRPQ